jgi:hypothetical protein
MAQWIESLEEATSEISRQLVCFFSQTSIRTISYFTTLYVYAISLLKSLSTGHLLAKENPRDERKTLFDKSISQDEMKKDTNIYRSLVFKDIYPEYKLKEYVNEIKKIVTSNRENYKGVFEVLTSLGPLNMVMGFFCVPRKSSNTSIN